MDNDTELVALEINTVIAKAEAVESFAVALHFAEILEIAFQSFLREPAKFAEDVKLKFTRHFRQLGGANRIKNDLK